MPQLSISFLGSFDARLENRSLTGFRSDKARALLAYLAVDSDRTHTRSKLASLLWPDAAEATALTYLRHAMANLHKVLDDRAMLVPFLHTQGDPIHFNIHSPSSCDVTAFTTVLTELTSLGAPPLTTSIIQTLQDALALYRGPFLEGFSLADSDRFEEWVLLRREQLHRLALSGLDALIIYYQAQGAAAQALPYVQRYVELEPTSEQGQRRLIELLMQLGQRSAALAQFERCRMLLADELGVTPAPETLALYQQLQTHTDDHATDRFRPLPSNIPLTRLPPFLTTAHARIIEPTPLLARQAEVAVLQQQLERAGAGLGGLVWISGEAGQGKTTLAHGFVQQAQATNRDLVVVYGNCNAHTGLSDPYLPFRQVLSLLTGDVEALWRAGAIMRTHATQLWHLLPHAGAALLAHGPDLVDTLLPAQSLLSRAAAYHSAATQAEAAWLIELRALVDCQMQKGEARGAPRQSDLFVQYTQVLQTLADQQPILLVLDDLQWADLGSIHLLLHLGRQLGQSRILIMALYRPAEVAAGRNGHPHPLLDVLHELPRHAAVTEVTLAHADGRRLVDAILDREPNVLAESFRQQLHRYTAGNPLFTIELVRGMQARGDLVRDPEGRWQVGAQLNWEQLPPRVEAVIGERILRLAPDLQEVLTLAGVEGESFTAEVIAQALQVPPREVVRWLSRELDRQHQLVTLQSVQHLGEQTITTYRFRHILFQKYLYGRLDVAERTYFHAAIGVTLEGLYREESETRTQILSQLARHFEEARQWFKVATYLYRISKRAIQFAVPDEAITQAKRGIAYLQKVIPTPEHSQLELSLQITQGVAWLLKEGYASYNAMLCYERAEILSTEVGDLSELFPALAGLCSTYRLRAYLTKSLATGERMIRLAEQQQDSKLLAIAQINTGPTLIHMGRLVEARYYLEAALAYKSSASSLVNLHTHAHDVTIMNHSYLAFTLGTLGYLAQAQTHTVAAIQRGQQLGHPNSHAFALFTALLVQLLRRDPLQAADYVTQLRVLAAQHESIHFWIDWLPPHLGWLALAEGNFAQSLTFLHDWLPLERLQGETVSPLTWQFAMLAIALYKVGQIKEGLHVVAVTLEHAKRIDERWWEAELYRLRGVLLLRCAGNGLDQNNEAAAAFQQAIAIAQRQQTKLWELRAATSLARLWQQQGRAAEAHHLLQPVYAWFTEGFDTADLCAAKALLDVLSTSSADRSATPTTR